MCSFDSCLSFQTTVISNPAANNSAQVGQKIKCKKLSKTEVFKCQGVDLYRALTNKDVSLVVFKRVLRPCDTFDISSFMYTVV